MRPKQLGSIMNDLPLSQSNDPLAEAFDLAREEQEMPEETLQRLIRELRDHLIRLDQLNPETHQKETLETVQAIKDVHAQFDNHITFKMLIDGALSLGEKEKVINRLDKLLHDWQVYANKLEIDLQKAQKGNFNWKHAGAGAAAGWTLYNGYTVLLDAFSQGVYTGDPYADMVRGAFYGVTGAGLLKAFKNARDNSDAPQYQSRWGGEYFEYGQAGLFAGLAMAFVDHGL